MKAEEKGVYTQLSFGDVRRINDAITQIKAMARADKIETGNENPIYKYKSVVDFDRETIVSERNFHSEITIIDVLNATEEDMNEIIYGSFQETYPRGGVLLVYLGYKNEYVYVFKQFVFRSQYEENEQKKWRYI
jgi:hypothetical protein